MLTWWLSFAEPGVMPNFLGVAIVEAKDFAGAVRLCHELGINPGGEVQGGCLTQGLFVPAEYKNKLLSWTKAAEADSLIAYGDS